MGWYLCGFLEGAIFLRCREIRFLFVILVFKVRWVEELFDSTSVALADLLAQPWKGGVASTSGRFSKTGVDVANLWI